MVDANLVVAVVSLVIAIIAFVVAIAQATQQFVSSAEGYRSCREGVMGLWGKMTKRRFTWEEVRFKVMLRTPVLFVAVPGNDRGPILDRPIFEITGSNQSYNDTHCRMPAVQKRDETAGALRVRTADDEYATWVVLMETLQKAEAEGRQWDFDQAKKGTAKAFAHVPYSLVVQVQEKKRSWDQMPDAVKKPFATTNISHVVEMAALLGMQWVKFDQDNWNLRAEGNGFMLLSQSIWGLGVSVSFSVTGRSSFAEKRMIPCHAIKAMLFGSVDTIFHGLQLNFEPKKEKWEDMYITQRTLRRLKLDRKTMERYFDRKEHSVVRSGKYNRTHSLRGKADHCTVSFEMIAMLGQVLRIPGSSFKRLPNPTSDPWLNDLDPCRIQYEFQQCIKQMIDEPNTTTSDQLRWIQTSWTDTLRPVWKHHESHIDITLRDAVQQVLEQCDSYLTNCGEATVIFAVGAHISAVLEEITDPQSFLHSRECDTEEEIWQHYFDKILKKVLAFKGTSEAEKVIARTASVVNSPTSPIAIEPPVNTNGSIKTASISSVSKVELRQDIWLTLMFRMSLWWLLHDFDENDQLIIPTRLKGSRMPVYIL